MQLDVVIFKANEEEAGGYSAAAEGFPIFTQGDTFEELKHNVIDAIQCHFGDKLPRKFDITLEQDLASASL